MEGLKKHMENCRLVSTQCPKSKFTACGLFVCLKLNGSSDKVARLTQFFDLFCAATLHLPTLREAAEVIDGDEVSHHGRPQPSGESTELGPFYLPDEPYFHLCVTNSQTILHSPLQPSSDDTKDLDDRVIKDKLRKILKRLGKLKCSREVKRETIFMMEKDRMRCQNVFSLFFLLSPGL